MIIPALAPLILKDLKLTYLDAGAVFAVYLATYAAGQIPVGLLAAKVNRSLLMGGGLLVTALGTLLTALAPNYLAILLFQALAGLGGAAHHPLALYLISEVYPRERRGRALGVHGFSSSLSFTLTPLAVAALTCYGWRMPLICFSALAALTGLLIMAFIHAGRGPGEDPSTYVRLLKSREFQRLLTLFACFSTGERGLISFLPLFLIFLYGFTVEQAGWWYSLFFLAGLAGQPLIGYLADRLGWRKVILTLLTASIILILGIASGRLHQAFLVVLGFTLMSSVVLHDIAAAYMVPEKARGLGFGLIFTVGIAFASLSAGFTGFLAESLGFQPAYMLLTIPFLLEIPILVGLRRRRS